MRNVESSMDWMSFSNKMKQVACRLSSSACPMVLVLPDGREIRFTDINVDTFDYKGKRGDTEYTSIGYKVNLLGAEVTDVQDDGSLANSPSGNGAKMCEALEQIAKLMDRILVRTELDDEIHRIALEAQNMADGVLSLSPRECGDALLKMASHSYSDSVVPESREIKKDLSHVDMICKAFINDHEWWDGTNMYAPRCSVYAVLPYGENAKWDYAFSGTSYKESKKLFMPTDAEIQSALNEFKKKGWHAQYDSESGYYAVFDGTRALGEYQARYTRNLF